MNSSSYQHNNLDMPEHYSLRVYSINGTTAFQCMIDLDPNATSTEGIVTVNGMWDTFCYVFYASVYIM